MIRGFVIYEMHAHSSPFTLKLQYFIKTFGVVIRNKDNSSLMSPSADIPFACTHESFVYLDKKRPENLYEIEPLETC